MLNDRDDDDNKYEGHEESEYHFSEDDVSYEVETETPKSAPESKEPKESLTAKLGRSKRMLISGGVFLVLIFVVYKMVSPPTATQSTDITPPSLAQQSAITTKPATTTPAAAPTTGTTTPAVAPPPAALAVAPTPPTPPTATAPITPAATQPAATTPTTTSTAQAPTAPLAQSPDASPSLMTGMPANAITDGTAQPIPAATTTTTTTASQPPATTGMPAVIPVQSNMASTTGTPAQQPQVVSDSALAAMQANNEKLVSQMQAQYEQKLSDYQVQNKALQSQVDTLTSKVSAMQGQLGDLVKALTRAQAAAAPPPDAIPPPSADRVGSAGSSGYNVQAIIPGRAWLRSDAGDTVTVAEGDVIRGLGKVTKIDPYDGVVVINTGMKTLSLSYGNGS